MSNDKDIKIPIKEFPDGSYWLLIGAGLETDSIIFRANKIIKNKNRPQDYDTHHCDQASAKGSIKCKPKSYFITDKLLSQ